MFTPRACHQAALTLAAACGAAASPCALAQSTTQSPLVDQTVVTVSSRLPLAADRLAADAVVITREQLAALPADNLADALQALAGVQVSRTGGPGQPTSVFIRGASASNTLVLIDGVRVGSATLGQFDFANIGLAGIERIEVLRGPGASLHGADAVGGVVLVTTRQAAPAGLRHRASASLGSSSSSEVSAATHLAQGTWDVQLQGAHQASTGISAVRPGDRFGNYNPDADGYRRQTLQASGAWRPVAGHRIEATLLQARLFSRYDASEFAPPDFSPNPRLDFSTRTDTTASHLRYEGGAGALTWRARMGRGEEDSTSGGQLLDRYRTERQEAGAQLGWTFARGHALVAAWDQLDERVSTNNYSTPGTRENQAQTLAYTGQFGAVQVQLDGREDRNSVYGNHRTGRSGMRWALGPDTALRLLAATTFRAPSFNELYFPGFGVPTLKPESGRSLEAGVLHKVGTAQWQASLWRNRVRDLIAYAADPALCPKSSAYAFGCAANIGQAELKGLTVEAQWPQGAMPGVPGVSGARGVPTWRVGYDGVDARDDKGQTLPRRARHQWRVQSQHTLAGWQLASAWLWQSQRREGGVALRDGTRLDLQAVRPLGPWMPGMHDWSLRLAVLNALDRDIEPARDYQAPRRQFTVGLRWEGR